MNNTRRYLARFVWEAMTPLAVGCGEASVHADDLVARDFNGLPYVPGTALTGVLRHAVAASARPELGDVEDWLGSSLTQGREDEGRGSRLMISDALLAGPQHQVLTALTSVSELAPDDFFKKFQRLPVREHVRIEDTGAAAHRGKFNEEVVYKGTRFKGEVELVGTAEDAPLWQALLPMLATGLQVGAGETRGFGQLKAKEIQVRVFDMTQRLDAEAYLKVSADLNQAIPGAEVKDPEILAASQTQEDWQSKSVTLPPAALHLGVGHGDEWVDAINYKEGVITWDDLIEPTLSEPQYVIPGSALKGVLAHRVAWLYNKQEEFDIERHQEQLRDKIEAKVRAHFQRCYDEFRRDIDRRANGTESEISKLGSLRKKMEALADDYDHEVAKIQFDQDHNPAVVHLFGAASREGADAAADAGQAGLVMIEDVWLAPLSNGQRGNGQLVDEWTMDHNAIDRYTGGTIQGALFNEQVFMPRQPLVVRYKVHAQADPAMVALLEAAVAELAAGVLPVGGRTTKGHGAAYAAHTTI